ncbi:MAG: AAA family ATPase [Dehalococcoidales bacterium]|nr:AAA family ATPase [Dehalococcoidales bacterium]
MSIVKVVAIVGMAGSGKSEAARVFEAHGYARVRFGDITDEELRRRGLPLNEQNERAVREALRKEHGMAAYAKLSLPRIEAALKKSNVVADGLYSWEEYKLLKDHFGDKFTLIAVATSPATRYRRLASRPHRPLTQEEAASRDRAEIENLNKGGPIAMADFVIRNDSAVTVLQKETERIIAQLK